MHITHLSPCIVLGKGRGKELVGIEIGGMGVWTGIGRQKLGDGNWGDRNRGTGIGEVGIWR